MVYPSTMSDRTEPLDEPPMTPMEGFDRCVHAAACERLYCSLVDGREYFGKEDEMVMALRCGEGDCDCWEEA